MSARNSSVAQPLSTNVLVDALGITRHRQGSLVRPPASTTAITANRAAVIKAATPQQSQRRCTRDRQVTSTVLSMPAPRPTAVVNPPPDTQQHGQCARQCSCSQLRSWQPSRPSCPDQQVLTMACGRSIWRTWLVHQRALQVNVFCVDWRSLQACVWQAVFQSSCNLCSVAQPYLPSTRKMVRSVRLQSAARCVNWSQRLRVKAMTSKMVARYRSASAFSAPHKLLLTPQENKRLVNNIGLFLFFPSFLKYLKKSNVRLMGHQALCRQKLRNCIITILITLLLLMNYFEKIKC